jgi:predicted ATPase
MSRRPCPHVFAAVGALLDAVARHRRLVLVVDDLQWADRPTLLLLRYVVHAARAAPLTILATIRDDEPFKPDLRRVLVDLLRERVLDRIALRELDEVETAQLLSAHLDDRPHPAAVQAILAQTRGNPFFVEELVREAPADGSVPAGVCDAVASRLERLPASTRRVLAVAAATGESFDLTTVSRHADAPRGAMRDGLKLAVRTGLLVADVGQPEQFSFRHEVVRRALLAQ